MPHNMPLIMRVEIDLYFVNASRGPIANEAALLVAVGGSRIRAAVTGTFVIGLNEFSKYPKMLKSA